MSSAAYGHQPHGERAGRIDPHHPCSDPHQHLGHRAPAARVNRPPNGTRRNQFGVVWRSPLQRIVSRRWISLLRDRRPGRPPAASNVLAPASGWHLAARIILAGERHAAVDRRQARRRISMRVGAPSSNGRPDVRLPVKIQPTACAPLPRARPRSCARRSTHWPPQSPLRRHRRWRRSREIRARSGVDFAGSPGRRIGGDVDRASKASSGRIVCSAELKFVLDDLVWPPLLTSPPSGGEEHEAAREK